MTPLLAAHLKTMRHKAGLSQKEVSRALGYTSCQIVSNWERGLCHPPLSKISWLIRLYRMNGTTLIKMMIQDYETNLEIKIKKGTSLIRPLSKKPSATVEK